jgi:hypothetical protein
MMLMTLMVVVAVMMFMIRFMMMLMTMIMVIDNPSGDRGDHRNGEGADVVPMDEQGEPVYPFLDEMDIRNNMLMRNPLLD